MKDVRNNCWEKDLKNYISIGLFEDIFDFLFFFLL